MNCCMTQIQENLLVYLPTSHFSIFSRSFMPFTSSTKGQSFILILNVSHNQYSRLGFYYYYYDIHVVFIYGVYLTCNSSINILNCWNSVWSTHAHILMLILILYDQHQFCSFDNKMHSLLTYTNILL